MVKTRTIKGLPAKEYHRRYNKEWGKNNRDKTKKSLYAWRKNNPEKLKEIAKRYYEKNREKRLKNSRNWYKKNKDWVIFRNKRWRGENRVKIKVYRHNRENLIKKGIKTGTINESNVIKLVEYQKDICALCEKKMYGKYTFDHIVPLSKGGHHEIYNIQLAHHYCNSMKQNKINEKDILKTITEWLFYKKIFWYRQNSGAFKNDKGGLYWFGAKGSPDIICVVNGRYIGIEVKGPKGKQSPAQAVFEKNLVEAGGKYILAYCLEDVIEFFNKL